MDSAPPAKGFMTIILHPFYWQIYNILISSVLNWIEGELHCLILFYGYFNNISLIWPNTR